MAEIVTTNESISVIGGVICYMTIATECAESGMDVILTEKLQALVDEYSSYIITFSSYSSRLVAWKSNIIA